MEMVVRVVRVALEVGRESRERHSHRNQCPVRMNVLRSPLLHLDKSRSGRTSRCFDTLERMADAAEERKEETGKRAVGAVVVDSGEMV